jgi:long-chain fatty acid transport protein
VRVAIFLILTFASRLAFADSLLPNTPRPMALAGAYTAISDDPAALYFNPAGLSRVTGSSAALEFSFAIPSFSAGPVGQPRSSLDARSDDGYGIYLAWSPEKLFGGGLGLGFSLLLPHRRAMRFNLHDADEPYFVLFENSGELLETRIGASYEFFDLFSIGGSVLLLGGLDGTVEIDAPFQSRNDIDPNKVSRLSLGATLPNKEFFTVGAQVYPIEGLTIGLTYREATFVRVRLPIDFEPVLFDIELPTVATLDVKVKYTPPQLALGAAYRFSPDLLVSLDLTWAMYSEYELPYGDIDLDLSRIGEDITLLPPRRAEAQLRDVLVPRIAAEWNFDPDLTLRAGYYFLRSFIRTVDLPVLDSDKHSLSLGASYRIDRLFFGDSQVRWTVSASGQALIHTSRKTAGFEHAGAVIATSFGSEIQY